MSDVSLESGIDMDKDVSDEMRDESLRIKGEANKAFAGGSLALSPLDMAAPTRSR